MVGFVMDGHIHVRPQHISFITRPNTNNTNQLTPASSLWRAECQWTGRNSTLPPSSLPWGDWATNRWVFSINCATSRKSSTVLKYGTHTYTLTYICNSVWLTNRDIYQEHDTTYIQNTVPVFNADLSLIWRLGKALAHARTNNVQQFALTLQKKKKTNLICGILKSLHKHFKWCTQAHPVLAWILQGQCKQL